MLASKLIEELQKVIAENGDVEMCTYDSHWNECDSITEIKQRKLIDYSKGDCRDVWYWTIE